MHVRIKISLHWSPRQIHKQYGGQRSILSLLLWKRRNKFPVDHSHCEGTKVPDKFCTLFLSLKTKQEKNN